MLCDQAEKDSAVGPATLQLCSGELSGCNGDQYVQILLDVSMYIPLSVAHCLFDLRLCRNDDAPCCCECADTVEVALQALVPEGNGNGRQRRLCQVPLTKGALRPCCR